MKLIILMLFMPFLSFAQEDTILNRIPFKDGQIVYEKVFYLDSVNDKDKVFNAAKAAIIRNSNYKYSKVDEDRVARNITTEISFPFAAKPGIVRITLTAKARLSIDVRENRFRVRVYDNLASFILMGETVSYELLHTYSYEKEQVEKGKWRVAKSVAVPWDEKLSLIMNTFGLLIYDSIKDDF